MKFLTNCIVAVPKLETTKVGLIHIPDAHSRQYVGLCEATVHAVGTKYIHKDDVSKGNIVLVTAQFGDPIKGKGIPTDARIYHGDDVHAIITS